MLTTTSNFDKQRERRDVESGYILKIIGDTNTYYFSDKKINLSTSGIKTEPTVLKWGNLKQAFDLKSKEAKVSNITIKMMNVPYMRASSGWRYLSEQLKGEQAVNRTAELYFWFEGLTDIDDCLKVFDGLIQPLKKVTPADLDLVLFDNSVNYHKYLPDDEIDGAQFPESPLESRSKYIPLVYGTFVKNAMTKGPLAECRFIGSNKLVVSDHVCKSVSAVWMLDENLGKLVRLDSGSYTATLDDSGFTTIELDPLILASCFVYPTRSEINDDSFYTGYPYVDGDNAKDRDDSTYMSIVSPAHVIDQNDCNANAYFYMHESLPDGGDWDAVYMELHWDRLNQSEVSFMYFQYWADTSNYQNYDMRANDGADDWISADMTSVITTAGLTWADIADSKEDSVQERMFRFNCDLIPSGGETTVATIKGMRLRIDYYPSYTAPTRFFVECEGREFGSWIDGGGRSNSYDEGDLIENPAGIVESILRDEMGLTDSEIDVDSFDAALGNLASWKQAVNIVNRIRSDNLFEEMGRQARFHAFFSSQGVAKIGTLDLKTSDVSDVSIGKKDIKRGGMELLEGDVKELVNDIDISYEPEIDKEYRDIVSGSNSTSQTNYNMIKKETIGANYISDTTTATALKDHYVGSAGYWKDLRGRLTLEMTTFEFVHLEAGDIVFPDSTVNDIIQYFDDDFGSASYAPLFLITEKVMGGKLEFEMQYIGNTGPPV